MITVTGGKWTAYRKMAEHAMLVATLRHLIPPRLCVTKDLPIFCDPNWDHAALEIEAEAGDAADERSFSSPSTPATTSSPARPRTCSFAVCASAR